MPRHIVYRDECTSCNGSGTIEGGGPFGNDIPCRCEPRPVEPVNPSFKTRIEWLTGIRIIDRELEAYLRKKNDGV